MTGFDRRPRVTNPVPWEKTQQPGAGIEYYFGAPSPNDLSNHLFHALGFVERQPAEHRAPAILIYAWNENDEGGWLIPTAPCNAERVEALHAALEPIANTNPGCRIAQ